MLPFSTLELGTRYTPFPKTTGRQRKKYATTANLLLYLDFKDRSIIIQKKSDANAGGMLHGYITTCAFPNNQIEYFFRTKYYILDYTFSLAIPH